MKKILVTVFVLTLVCVLVGCGFNSSIQPDQTSKTGNLKVAIAIPTQLQSNLSLQSVLSQIELSSLNVTITKGEKTSNKDVLITGSDVTVVFDNLETGEWSVEVSVKDSKDFIVYEGNNTATITEDATATVNINLELQPGNVVAKVIIPDSLGVASGTVTLIHPDLGIENIEQTLVIEGNEGTAIFNDLQPSTWQVEVELFDAEGSLVKNDNGHIDVLPGRTNNVKIEFAAPGGLVIAITWEYSPEAPVGLNGSLENDSVILTWNANANTESNIAGYVVYRSTDLSGIKKPLNAELIVDTTYTDATIELENTYYYWVQAYNSAGDSSDFSEPFEVTYVLSDEEIIDNVLNQFSAAWVAEDINAIANLLDENFIVNDFGYETSRYRFLVLLEEMFYYADFAVGNVTTPEELIISGDTATITVDMQFTLTFADVLDAKETFVTQMASPTTETGTMIFKFTLIRNNLTWLISELSMTDGPNYYESPKVEDLSNRFVEAFVNEEVAKISEMISTTYSDGINASDDEFIAYIGGLFNSIQINSYNVIDQDIEIHRDGLEGWGDIDLSVNITIDGNSTDEDIYFNLDFIKENDIWLIDWSNIVYRIEELIVEEMTNSFVEAFVSEDIDQISAMISATYVDDIYASRDIFLAYIQGLFNSIEFNSYTVTYLYSDILSSSNGPVGFVEINFDSTITINENVIEDNICFILDVVKENDTWLIYDSNIVDCIEDLKIKIVANSFVESFVNEDITQITNVISPNYYDGTHLSRDQFIAYIQSLFNSIDINSYNVTYQNYNIDQDTYPLEGFGNIRLEANVTINGDTTDNNYSFEWYFIKENDTWLIYYSNIYYLFGI